MNARGISSVEVYVIDSSLTFYCQRLVRSRRGYVFALFLILMFMTLVLVLLCWYLAIAPFGKTRHPRHFVEVLSLCLGVPLATGYEKRSDD